MDVAHPWGVDWHVTGSGPGVSTRMCEGEGVLACIYTCEPPIRVCMYKPGCDPPGVSLFLWGAGWGFM